MNAQRTNSKQAASTDAALQALDESKQAIQKAIQEVVEETRVGVRTAVQESKKAEAVKVGQGAIRVRPEVLPHAFVVMPFGKKKGTNDVWYDFNAIYKDLIKPALKEAGFEPFRADEATQSGDILTDMFHELLLADLVLCDLSIDNANAFYEVGIRHAFRKRGVVHIQSGRSYMPFDIFNVRTIPYTTTPEGVPDPKTLEKDKQAIITICRDTWNSEREAIHSPIFNLLPGLPEPDRKILRSQQAAGFWRKYEEWKGRMDIARRQKRIGDILLLTEEVTNPLMKEDAIEEAAKAMGSMKRFQLALEQYQKGLALNPANAEFRRKEAMYLNRLKRVDEAIARIEDLIKDSPGDHEAIAYLGRVYKEIWVSCWEKELDPEKRLRLAFDSAHWLLKSYNIYLKGFRVNLNEYYPGINALTLGTILVYLADHFKEARSAELDIKAVRTTLPDLQGALEFLLETKAADETADYWALASLAELRVLTARSPQQVVRAYRNAFPATQGSSFYLGSSLQQLEMLQSLGMRTDFVQTGLTALREEEARMGGEEDAKTPKKERGVADIDRRVFVFTGYMIDAPREKEKNFPPALEAPVKRAIQQVLDKLQIVPADLAMTSGLAAGGDLLFAECCVERGIPVKVYMPLPDQEYVREFVSPCGDAWVERFYKLRSNPLVSQRYQLDRLGPPRQGDDRFERNNRWVMYSALGSGVDKVRAVALYESKNVRANARDARLVSHMLELARESGVRVEQISLAQLGVETDAAAEPKAKRS